MKIFLTIAFVISALCVGFIAFSDSALALDVLPDFLRPSNISVIGDSGQTAESRTVAIIARVLQVLLALAGVLTVLFMVAATWTMVISAGEEEKFTEAKRALTWAIVGLLLLLFTYTLVRFVFSFAFQADPEEGEVVSSALKQGLAFLDLLSVL